MITTYSSKSAAIIITAVLFILLLSPKAESQVINYPHQGLHFTEQELAWIKQHPDVTVGFVKDMEPVLIIDKDGKHQGLLPEYLALLSEHSGINFRIKPSSSWKSMILDGVTRKVDMLGAITPQKAFEQYFDFTQVISKTNFFIFGANNIQTHQYDLESLSGKRVGYIDAFRNIESLSKQHKNINFISYPDRDGLIAALQAGEIEFVINNGTMEYWRKTNRKNLFKTVGAVPELSTNIVMGVRNDWPELLSILNKVINSTNEERILIADHWLGHDINGIAVNPAMLTKEEQDWIIKHPIIRVGVDPSWAPIEFIGSDNQAEGMSIQYLDYLEDILGLRFEVSKTRSWTKVLEQLEQSTLDLLPAISTSHAKQKSFHFTKPYLSTPNGIFSAMNSTYLSGIGALKGKRVVIVEGYAIHSWLKDKHPEIDLITTQTIEDALKKISGGEAFAFIGNLITTSYYIGQTGLTQIRVVGEVSYTNELAMAVRKDWKILSTILDKGIAAIPQSKKQSIYNSWISIKYQHGVDYSLMWQLLGVATFILFIILYWNHRLAREIDYRHTVEKKLLVAKLEAEKATLSKSEFLANMSHEIRTPLNAVIGIGHLIRKTDLTAEQNDYITKMHSSSDALLDVINNILDFSKGDAGKLKLNSIRFSLRENLQEVIDILYTSMMEKGLSLHLHIDDNIPDTLKGDPQKLAQILRNFGSNAVKFTSQGTVKLSVELLEFRNDVVQLCFSVSDTGIGICPKDQKILFKPFSQADSSITRNFGGTGLGLVICQQLSHLLGGEIHLESKLGKGSTFTFTTRFDVPKQSDQTIKTVTSRKNNTIKQNLHNIKVLVVEDDLLNQLLMKKYLFSFGANATLADNGELALALLKKNVFDIVLMDIQMPVLDGYGTTRLIRLESKWKDLPIIAVTAHALNSEQIKCYEVGMNDYITKPINPDNLQSTILKWATPT